MGRYAVALVRETREHSDTAMGSSPRGSLALIRSARALALINGREFVIPEDIKALAHACLEHRVVIRPELWLQNISCASVIDSILTRIDAPEAAA